MVPELELISAGAMARYTAVLTPPLTRGAAESVRRTTQMASAYYRAAACQQRAPPFLILFLCLRFLKGYEMDGKLQWNKGFQAVCRASVHLSLVKKCLLCDCISMCFNAKYFCFDVQFIQNLDFHL